jgi:hypothetical protein
MSPNPRRSTDLDSQDLECLIKLCETRIHTINLHLKRNNFTNNTETMKAHEQLEDTLSKLKRLKDRLLPECDGA